MKVVGEMGCEEVWFEFVCWSCGAKCKAEPSDVEVLDGVASGLSWNCQDLFYTVACGNCGKARDVPVSKLTKRIKDNAARKGCR